MIRLTNDNLGRALHSSLYNRIHKFCVEYCPEMPAELFVNTILTRLYNSDPLLHIMVTLDSHYNITEHAVVDIQTAFGRNVIYCHQLAKDSPNIESMNEFMEYLDKLKEQTNAVCIAFTVVKNVKVYQSKYGYKTMRTVMIKTDTNAESE